MHPEMKQFLRLAAIIVSVILLASLGLVFESVNGLAWLAAVPIFVAAFLLLRRQSSGSDKEPPSQP